MYISEKCTPAFLGIQIKTFQMKPFNLRDIYLQHLCQINIALLWVYSALFSIAAVTNCHRLGELKTHKFILIQFERPEAWTSFTRPKPKCLQDCASFKDSRRESIALPFQLLELYSLPFSASNFCLYSLVHGLFFHLQKPKYMQMFSPPAEVITLHFLFSVCKSSLPL